MSGRERPARPVLLRLYELGVILPLVAWVAVRAVADPAAFAEPMLVVWAVAIAAVDLLPIATPGTMKFSLSFPLQLAVALLYPAPVAGLVAMTGTSDPRELRRELTVSKALFSRAQIAASVIAESLIFHGMASVHSPWYRLAGAVLVATVAGYAVNVALVACYSALASGRPVDRVVREMHVGIVGEFLVSYMGLATFGVFIASFFVEQGLWSIVVFLAPLAFARQMFARTQSLQRAKEELEAREREKAHQAVHDALTGLPNRTLFLDRLAEALGSREEGSGVAVVIMDLDQFKEINDALGHHYGDLLLRDLAPRLERLVREGDTVARLGGDEFGVVLPRIPNEDAAIEIAQRMIEVLDEPVLLEGLALNISGSIGIALYPQHSVDAESLVRNADVAMYAAKESQSGFAVYSPAADRYSAERLALLSQVRPAIEGEQFVLHFQPKAALRDGRIVGTEVLLRWQHPQRGLIFPDQFIPLAERTVLLRPLTMHVLEGAVRQCRDWRARGLELHVAVNLSTRNLLDLELPDQVARILDHWGVPASCLAFEITESTLMADSIRSMQVLARFSQVGVSLAIDDFGTGYSSLGYLKRLPVDEIKIDRTFVMNMARDQNDELIVRATVDLAHNLGLRVVAEGVETAEIWRQLAALDCDVAQGYFLSRPLPADELEAWMAGRVIVSGRQEAVHRAAPPRLRAGRR